MSSRKGEKTGEVAVAGLIARNLDLNRPRFLKTAAYGHFGRDDLDTFTWCALLFCALLFVLSGDPYRWEVGGHPLSAGTFFTFKVNFNLLGHL